MSTPTTPKTPTPPTLPAGITKICHIVKRDDFDGYGFNLHSEKTKPGQFIGKVDPKSPAELAGLKEGDRILEVNGVSIGSETHKQVVARIKAIADEVRLLLIDVDGKGDEAMAKASSMPATNGNAVACADKAECGESNSGLGGGGTKQEMPGASANISSISMVSTKRASNSSGSNQSGSSTINMDVVDKAAAQHNGFNMEKHEQQQQQQQLTIEKTAAINNNNNNNSTAMMMTTTTTTTAPPPPSAAVAMPNNNNNKSNNMIYSTTTTSTTTTTKTATTNGNGHGSNNNNNNNNMSPATTPTTPPLSSGAASAASASAAGRAGGLNLPLTAAEMRAKLASRKKYDPKNESVDLKKKFEIIQKL